MFIFLFLIMGISLHLWIEKKTLFLLNYSGLDVFEVCPKTLETGIPLPYTHFQLKVIVLGYKLWGISVLLKHHSEEMCQLKADKKFRVTTIMNLKDKRWKKNTEIRTWIPICLLFSVIRSKLKSQVNASHYHQHHQSLWSNDPWLRWADR